MKKLLALGILALSLTACNPTSSDEPETSSSVDVSSSSQNVSSSSEKVSSSSKQVSSSSYRASSSSQTKVQVQTMYIAEMGTVCVGFNIDAVRQGYAFDGFMAMYNICGDRAQQTSGLSPVSVGVVIDWMQYTLALNNDLTTLIANDVDNYGGALRFYNANDGYLRYVYIEPVGDGKGLMKVRTK